MDQFFIFSNTKFKKFNDYCFKLRWAKSTSIFASLHRTIASLHRSITSLHRSIASSRPKITGRWCDDAMSLTGFRIKHTISLAIKFGAFLFIILPDVQWCARAYASNKLPGIFQEHAFCELRRPSPKWFGTLHAQLIYYTGNYACMHVVVWFILVYV